MKIKLLTSLIQIFVYLILKPSFAKANEKSWSFELLEVYTNTSNPDLCDLNLEIVRVSRGVFALSGFMNLQIDVDDSTVFEVFLYRSNTVGNSFNKLPMEIANETLTNSMNTFYKEIVMDDLRNCSKNLPVFDEFVAPLTKRYAEIENCVISTDNMPSHMSEGVYRLLMKAYGPAVVVVDLYFKIEAAYYY